jgi:arylsulfatase A-like enzyme
MSRSIATFLFAALLTGCGAPSEPSERIVLITLDTLRHDSFSDDGERSPTMPLTRAWAEQGRVFERHFAVTSTTGPTHATLLTGEPPWRHGITRNGLILPPEIATIPERLSEVGWETGAVVGSFALHRTFGFDQGFDAFRDEFQRDFLGMREWSGAEVPGGAFFSLADFVTGQAIEMLDRSGGGNQFFWFHYFDPHAPYGATGERSMEVDDIRRGARREPGAVAALLAEARELYDADVRFLDRELDRLFRRLGEDEGRYETHVFIVSDHGESFGENGVLAHGSRISDEQIRVPLIVRSPLVEPGIESAATGSIDVAHAILEIAGIGDGEEAALLSGAEPSRRVFGMRQTFQRKERERRTDDRNIFPSALRFYCVDGDRVYRGDWSGILGEDGKPVEGDLASTIRTAFNAFEREVEGQSPEEVLDEKALEALRALGYLR